MTTTFNIPSNLLRFGGCPQGPPRSTPPPPPPCPNGDFGAVRYRGQVGNFTDDIETVLDKHNRRYLIRFEQDIGKRYRLTNCGGGVFWAWSLLRHCHQIKQCREGILYYDWEGLDRDVRDKAREVVEQEVKDLKKWTKTEQPSQKKETQESIKHREMMLLLGEPVVLSKMNTLEELVVKAEGILRGFGDNLIDVGGNIQEVDEDDLVRGRWKVEAKKEGKEKKKGKETGRAETDGSSDGEWSILTPQSIGSSNEEGEMNERERPQNAQGVELGVEEMTKWIRELSLEQRSFLSKALGEG